MPKKEKRSEVGRYAKVYTGGEGLVVTVLRYGPEENREYLVGIDGVDHPCDGQIFLHKTENGGSGLDYRMTYQGKPWTTFIMRSQYGGEYFEACPPGFKNGIKVFYDEKRSKEVVPEHMLTAFLEGKKAAA